MKEKIKSAVKTAYAKFGLKAESIEKIANIIEARVTAMGTIENEDEVIASEVAASEPLVAVIQSEVDSRAKPVVPVVESPKSPTPQNPENKPAEEMPQWAKDLQARLDAKEQNEKAASDRAAFVATIKATKGFENEKVRNMILNEAAFDMSKTAEENSALFKTKYDKYCSEFSATDAIPGFGGQGDVSAGTGGLDSLKDALRAEGKIPTPAQ